MGAHMGSVLSQRTARTRLAFMLPTSQRLWVGTQSLFKPYYPTQTNFQNRLITGIRCLWGKRIDCKGVQRLLQDGGIVCILIWVMVTQVKMRHTVHLRFVHFSVYKLYLNKVVSFKYTQFLSLRS